MIKLTIIISAAAFLAWAVYIASSFFGKDKLCYISMIITVICLFILFGMLAITVIKILAALWPTL